MIISTEKFKTGSLYLLAAFFGPISGILINPLLAKNLSHMDYSVIGYFSSFQILLIPISSFNFNTFFLKNTNHFEKENRRQFINTILFGQALIGFIATLFFCAAFYLYMSLSADPFEYYPFALFSFLQIYFSLFITFHLVQLRADRNAIAYASVSIISVLIYIFLTLVFVVFLRSGAEGKLGSALLSSIAGSVYVIYKIKPSIRIDWQLFKSAFKFCFPLTISALFWYFLSGLDKALLASRGGELDYGNYVVAGQISSYMAIFYTAANNIFEPDIYRAIAEQNKSRLRKLLATVISLVFAINILYIAFADHIISLLTSGRYVASSGFSRILALQNIAMTAYYLAIKLFIGYGMIKEELAVRIIGAGFTFFILSSFITKFGFYGAAWGQVCSFTLLALMSISVFYYRKNRREHENKNFLD